MKACSSRECAPLDGEPVRSTPTRGIFDCALAGTPTDSRPSRATAQMEYEAYLMAGYRSRPSGVRPAVWATVLRAARFEGGQALPDVDSRAELTLHPVDPGVDATDLRHQFPFHGVHLGPQGPDLGPQ